jgi:hypothetical protein
VALVRDPASLPESVLVELADSLRRDLEETTELVQHPRGRVLEPASLRTAEELLEASRAALDALSTSAGPDEYAVRVNLAYATMLAVIDLVKTHTDVPKVPPPR